MHPPRPGRGGRVRNVILPVAVPMPANLPLAARFHCLALSVFVIGLGSLKTFLFGQISEKYRREAENGWIDRGIAPPRLARLARPLMNSSPPSLSGPRFHPMCQTWTIPGFRMNAL